MKTATCDDVTFVGGDFGDNDDDDDVGNVDDVDGDENCFSFPLSWSLVTLEGWQWVRPRPPHPAVSSLLSPLSSSLSSSSLSS